MGVLGYKANQSCNFLKLVGKADCQMDVTVVEVNQQQTTVSL